MNLSRLITYIFLSTLVTMPVLAKSPELTIYHVMQRVLDRFPSSKNSEMEVLKSVEQKLKSESLKLKEAEHRFRSGRENTAQLIQFQNEYSFAQLSLQNQNVDLNNRITALQLFTGQFWDALINRNVQHGVNK